MGRTATLGEEYDAWQGRNRKQGLAEKILRLRYAGWSHEMAMSLLREPTRRPSWADAPQVLAEQQSPGEHGIPAHVSENGDVSYLLSNRRSGRKRQRAKATRVRRFDALYSQG